MFQTIQSCILLTSMYVLIKTLLLLLILLLLLLILYALERFTGKYTRTHKIHTELHLARSLYSEHIFHMSIHVHVGFPRCFKNLRNIHKTFQAIIQSCIRQTKENLSGGQGRRSS